MKKLWWNALNILVIIVLVLTVYNTYMIHAARQDPVDLTDVNAKINWNAAEIQTLEENMATMVDFVNAKFESLKITVGE